MGPRSGSDGGLERQWQPTEDPAALITSTRQQVFAAVKRCIGNAIAKGLAADVRTDDITASNALFRELHICVNAYASGLYALGQTESGAIGLMLVAAREAAAPENLHPMIGIAIARWCRDARMAEAAPVEPRLGTRPVARVDAQLAD